MNIFVPNKKLWTPDNGIVIPSLMPARRFPMNLTPHRLMMGGSAFLGDKIAYSFDGTGDFLVVGVVANFKFLHGANDTSNFKWTINFSVKPNNFSVTQVFLDTTTAGGSADIGIFIGLTTGRNIKLLIGRNISGQSVIDGTFSTTYPNDTTNFHHIEITYDQSLGSANATLFIDGIASGTLNKTGNTPSTSNPDNALNIGRLNNNALFLNGRIDEVRILDGIVAHTSNFPVPINQYMSDVNTELLIHCGETKTGTTGSGATFTDSGNIGHTVTENGNAIEDTVNYRY